MLIPNNTYFRFTNRVKCESKLAVTIMTLIVKQLQVIFFLSFFYLHILMYSLYFFFSYKHFPVLLLCEVCWRSMTKKWTSFHKLLSVRYTLKFSINLNLQSLKMEVTAILFFLFEAHFKGKFKRYSKRFLVCPFIILALLSSKGEWMVERKEKNDKTTSQHIFIS